MSLPKFPAWLRVVWSVLRPVLVAYLLVLLAMTLIERFLVYPIPPIERSDWQPSGVVFEDVAFTSEDGTKLHGWFFPRDGASRAILYCHGNGEQVADNGELMQWLGERLDAEVFIFDYRGYGKSEGTPHERGVIADGLAAQRWLADHTGRQADEVTLVGRSIGGGVAVALAAEKGAAALILQSTFTRLTDAASQHYPWLPVRWLMRNRYDSLARIQQYDGPLFISHGMADRVVPVTLGQELFDASPSKEKEFFTIPGGGHNDGQPRAYYEALANFLSSTAN